MEQPKKPWGAGSAAPVMALLVALLCIPLIYVLSIGPVAAACVNQAAPTWVQTLYHPIEYLADNSDVFRVWIIWYIELWTK